MEWLQGIYYIVFVHHHVRSTTTALINDIYKLISSMPLHEYTNGVFSFRQIDLKILHPMHD